MTEPFRHTVSNGRRGRHSAPADQASSVDDEFGRPRHGNHEGDRLADHGGYGERGGLGEHGPRNGHPGPTPRTNGHSHDQNSLPYSTHHNGYDGAGYLSGGPNSHRSGLNGHGSNGVERPVDDRDYRSDFGTNTGLSYGDHSSNTGVSRRLEDTAPDHAVPDLSGDSEASFPALPSLPPLPSLSSLPPMPALPALPSLPPMPSMEPDWVSPTLERAEAEAASRAAEQPRPLGAHRSSDHPHPSPPELPPAPEYAPLAEFPLGDAYRSGTSGGALERYPLTDRHAAPEPSGPPRPAPTPSQTYDHLPQPGRTTRAERRRQAEASETASEAPDHERSRGRHGGGYDEREPANETRPDGFRGPGEATQPDSYAALSHPEHADHPPHPASSAGGPSYATDLAHGPVGKDLELAGPPVDTGYGRSQQSRRSRHGSHAADEPAQPDTADEHASSYAAPHPTEPSGLSLPAIGSALSPYGTDGATPTGEDGADRGTPPAGARISALVGSVSDLASGCRSLAADLRTAAQARHDPGGTDRARTAALETARLLGAASEGAEKVLRLLEAARESLDGRAAAQAALTSGYPTDRDAGPDRPADHSADLLHTPSLTPQPREAAMQTEYPPSTPPSYPPVLPLGLRDGAQAAVVARQVEAARRHLMAALTVGHDVNDPSWRHQLLGTIDQVLAAVVDVAAVARDALAPSAADTTFPGEARFLCVLPWERVPLSSPERADQPASVNGVARLLAALGYDTRATRTEQGVLQVEVRGTRYSARVMLQQLRLSGGGEWMAYLDWNDGDGHPRSGAETLGPAEIADDELARRVDDALRRRVGPATP